MDQSLPLLSTPSARVGGRGWPAACWGGVIARIWNYKEPVIAQVALVAGLDLAAKRAMSAMVES